MVSVKSNQHGCCHSVKVHVDGMQMSGRGCVPIKLYFYKQEGARLLVHVVWQTLAWMSQRFLCICYQ